MKKVLLLKSLRARYKSVPLQAKAAFWFAVCQAVQSGCKFLAMPVLVRLLTSEQYGTFSVFQSWVQILSVFATLNMSAGVFNVAMFKYRDGRDGYTAAAQSVSIAAALACACVYFLFRNFWSDFFGLPADLCGLIFIQLLFTEGFLVWTARRRYEYYYRGIIICTAVLSVLYSGLPIVFGTIFPPEERLRAVIYAGSGVQILFGACFIVYNYIKGKCFYNKEYWRFALKFNIPLIPHYLSGIILGQSDRIMIGNIVGAAEAGVYSFVYNISLIMNIVVNAVNSAIIPYTYEKIRQKDFGKLRVMSDFLLVTVGALAAAFSAVAPELIKIIATEEYYGAIDLVPAIVLSSYAVFAQCLFANFEFYFEANKFIAAASVLAAAANILLNALLIPIFGFHAAAYTTLFCYAVSAASHCFFMRIVCRRKSIAGEVYHYKGIAVISLCAAAASFGMLALYGLPPVRWLILLGITALAFFKRRRIVRYLKMLKEN